MKSMFLPFEKMFDKETSYWVLTGRDRSGKEFGVGASTDLDVAIKQLREWVVDCFLAVISDGEYPLDDLCDDPPTNGDYLVFEPSDLLPLMIRLLRVRRGWSQSEVAARIGINRQAYTRIERPGVNLELNTLVRVERALEESLLEYVPTRRR